jgi:hypothetical protein
VIADALVSWICGNLSKFAKCLYQAMPVFAKNCCAFFFLLALLSPPAFSKELPAGGLSADDVEVDYSDGTYSARFGFRCAASPAVVIDVLTDFNHMVGLVPNLESSRIVSRSGNVFLVEQRGKADFGPFSFPFESLRQIELLPDGRILGQALSGSTKYMRSELRVQALGGGAHIDYQIEVKPDRWVPAIIGVSFMRYEMAEQFTALIHEMERRQKIARSR